MTPYTRLSDGLQMRIKRSDPVIVFTVRREGNEMVFLLKDAEARIPLTDSKYPGPLISGILSCGSIR